MVPKLSGQPLEAVYASELHWIMAVITARTFEFAAVLEIWDAVCERCKGQGQAWERLSKRAIKEAAKRGDPQIRMESMAEIASVQHETGCADMASLVIQMAHQGLSKQPEVQRARLLELLAERVRNVDSTRADKFIEEAAVVSGALSTQGRLNETLRREAEMRAGRLPRSEPS